MSRLACSTADCCESGLEDLDRLVQQAALFDRGGSCADLNESGAAHRTPNLASAFLDGSGEVSEDFFGGLPANAGVGDRLPVGELVEVAVAEALVAFDEVGLDHD